MPPNSDLLQAPHLPKWHLHPPQVFRTGALAWPSLSHLPNHWTRSAPAPLPSPSCSTTETLSRSRITRRIKPKPLPFWPLRGHHSDLPQEPLPLPLPGLHVPRCPRGWPSSPCRSQLQCPSLEGPAPEHPGQRYPHLSPLAPSPSHVPASLPTVCLPINPGAA